MSCFEEEGRRRRFAANCVANSSVARESADLMAAVAKFGGGGDGSAKPLRYIGARVNDMGPWYSGLGNQVGSS